MPALALMLCLGCATYAVSHCWDGRRTTSLVPKQAWKVIEDEKATANEKLLAEIQLFRCYEESLEKLRELAKRDDEIGEQARKHLRGQ